MKKKRKNVIILLILITSFVSFGQTKHTAEVRDDPKCIITIPIKFYMMGEKKLDHQISNKIKQEVEKLNKAFKNQIRFQLIGITHDVSHAYLSNIREDEFSDIPSLADSLVGKIESQNTVNIFIFKSVKNENDRSLNGFTPKLISNFELYERVRPSFDRIYISYFSLSKMSNTLIHEFGHYLDIDHPSELSAHDRIRLNLVDTTTSNHMSYGSDFAHGEFTDEQILSMKKHLSEHRAYIIWKSNCSENYLTSNQ